MKNLFFKQYKFIQLCSHNFARKNTKKLNLDNKPNINEEFVDSQLENEEEITRGEILKDSLNVETEKKEKSERKRKWKIDMQNDKDFEKIKSDFKFVNNQNTKKAFNHDINSRMEEYLKDEKIQESKIIDITDDNQNKDDLKQSSSSKVILKESVKKLNQDKLNEFLNEIKSFNESTLENKQVFSNIHEGKSDKKKTPDYLVTHPTKKFKWSSELEELTVKPKNNKIFTKGQYPSYTDLVKYCEICRLKDIKVFPTVELGFFHLKQHSILTTGFNSKHIYKCAKDLTREVKQLEIKDFIVPTISGKRHSEAMRIDVGECSIYFFTEDSREQADLDNIWLNKKSLVEMNAQFNHERITELHKTKRKYKI